MPAPSASSPAQTASSPAQSASDTALVHSARPADAAFGLAGLLVLLVGLAMAVADFFIVNVALPTIGRTISADTAALELVVAGYGTAYAVFLVPGGRLGDTRGRRRMFSYGVAAFTTASAVCGIAPGPAVLVAARVVQGIAAAVLVPQVLATIQATFTGAERQRALGLYGATLGAAAVVGQLLGGIIVQADIAGLAWRPVFLVNVPIGIACLVLVRRLVPDTRGEQRTSLDLRGAALLAAGLLGLLIPATMGRELGWPAWSIALLVLPPVAGVALVRHARSMEAAGRDPLLPLSLLGSPALRAGLGVSLALFVAAGGFFLTTALTLQEGLRFSPLSAGLTMVPFAGAFLLISLAGGRLGRVLGSRLIVVGGLIYAAGMAVLALDAALGYGSETGLSLAPAMALIGIGQGAVVAPLFGFALTGVPRNRAGTASGLLTTAVQASLATGAATIGLVFLAALGRGGLAGYGQASATVAAVQAVLGLVVAGLATRLPAVSGSTASARAAADQETAIAA